MDKRQQKTKAAIVTAFNELLSVSDYADITVQDIIDKANIGRSTFYAHFETRDMLLTSLCSEVFEHIFFDKLPEQADLTCDENSVQNLELQLSHILFHLKNSRVDAQNILKGESRKIFLSYYKNYIELIFTTYLEHKHTHLPIDYLINFLTDSFVSTSSWWITSKSQYTPEEISSYYISAISNNL